MIEEWKTIEDYPDYQVSNLGRVKSFKKHNGTNERILKIIKNSKGYLFVILCNNEKSKIFKVHRLVLKAFKFISNLELFECNHIDGNKENNCIENLEWCTHIENMQHAVKIGLVNNKGENHPNYGKHPSEETKRKMSNNHLYIRGEKHAMYGKHHTEETKRKMSEIHKGEKSSNHILTEKQVKEIKNLIIENKLTQRKIAEVYGVSDNTVSMIKLGQRWEYVQC